MLHGPYAYPSVAYRPCRLTNPNNRILQMVK